jgi:hypothetical protein
MVKGIKRKKSQYKDLAEIKTCKKKGVIKGQTQLSWARLRVKTKGLCIRQDVKPNFLELGYMPDPISYWSCKMSDSTCLSLGLFGSKHPI